EGFNLAKAEAKASFGDDRVFVEKFIVDPRHIEIQVLGDKHGNVIYLGERECSIQRRNQKVIEEAPSPLLDEATRRKMGVQEGGEISIHYDPMIAKLVTHAPSRAAAIEAQATALDSFYVDGIRHNIPFLSALMHHPRWREGRLSTGFIAEEFPKGFAVRVPEGEVARRIAAVGAAIDHVLGERKRQISGQMGGRIVQRERRRAVWLDRQDILLEVAREGEAIAVRFVDASGKAGNAHQLQSPWKPGDPVWQGTIDGQFVAVQVRQIANGIRLAHQGVEVPVYVWTEAEATSARLMPVTTAADTGKKLLCPMPGLVVSIAVTEGREVKG